MALFVLLRSNRAIIHDCWRVSLGITCIANCGASPNEIDEQISGMRKSNLGILPIPRLEFKSALCAAVLGFAVSIDKYYSGSRVMQSASTMRVGALFNATATLAELHTSL